MTKQTEQVEKHRAKVTVRRDGSAIVAHIPMTFYRHSGRKQIVLPAGAIAPEPARSTTPVNPLALAVARAFAWEATIESGHAKSNSDLAERLGLDPSYVARTTRVTALAPDIIEAILDGREPESLQVEVLRHDIPLGWDEQRRLLGDGRHG